MKFSFVDEVLPTISAPLRHRLTSSKSGQVGFELWFDGEASNIFWRARDLEGPHRFGAVYAKFSGRSIDAASEVRSNLHKNRRKLRRFISGRLLLGRQPNPLGLPQLAVKTDTVSRRLVATGDPTPQTSVGLDWTVLFAGADPNLLHHGLGAAFNPAVFRPAFFGVSSPISLGLLVRRCGPRNGPKQTAREIHRVVHLGSPAPIVGVSRARRH
ncbi:hypothetical protein [Hansschlegelia plantiphila]|uniref:hypothetical protein n=1 Tax=Hansschlegelia plantiphila TaxID=374655 RepID=UPI0022F24B47|nr:hypothetical protein [Hansschlegelia plantiphila]